MAIRDSDPDGAVDSFDIEQTFNRDWATNVGAR